LIPVQVLNYYCRKFGQSQWYLFVFSAALPKIAVDGINVIALSPQSPLGQS
jgi:hypothetical protein